MPDVAANDLQVLDADGNTAEDVLQQVLADDPDDVVLGFLGHQFEVMGKVPSSDGGCGGCIPCLSVPCNCHLDDSV